MKVQNLLKLFLEFTRTEIIAAVELATWLLIKETDFYLMLWQTDYVRPAMILGLIAIPVIFAINEYQTKKKRIDKLLYSFHR